MSQDLKERLETEFSALNVADDPDRWALAAYQLALARSEMAANTDDLDRSLGLLDRAARILTAQRAPLEHARIVTAAANCHRTAGRADTALLLFGQAAELLIARAPRLEHAAALVNLGLAQSEAGQARPAVETLDAAVGLIGDTAAAGAGEALRPADASDPDETARLLGAALINRAQALQDLGSDLDLKAAIDDYRRAAAALPAESLQAGMAAHGLGAAILEQCRRGSSTATANEAVSAFERSLAVLGHSVFPFQHAVARHSLALAYERRGEAGDLARALNSVQASLTIFDPRLHGPHWRTAHATMARLKKALEPHGQDDTVAGHFVRLLAATTEREREDLLRERLRRVATLPAVRFETELQTLAHALTDHGPEDYERVTRTLLGVLMELPDPVLEAACASLCRAHRESESTAVFDEALDRVISDRLFGPQRVRVRDLLEAGGWVRP